MGQQSATTYSHEARLLSVEECFRPGVLLVTPPAPVCRHIGASGASNVTHATVRFLRSVAVRVVCWRAQRLFPEQWESVWGNIQVALVFIPPKATEEELGKWRTAVKEMKSVSPEAILVAIVVEVEAEVVPQEEEIPEEGEGSHSEGEDIEEEVFDEDASPYEEVETFSTSTLAIEWGCPIRRWREHNEEEKFLIECIVAQKVIPMELSRPLGSLLYELQQACGAAEGFLLDAETGLPLLNTRDKDPPLGSVIHRSLFAIHYRLRSIVNRLQQGLEYFALDIGTRRMYCGWASKPYVLVLLLLPDPKAALSSRFIHRNVSYMSAHLFNVIHNTSRLRQYTPLNS